MTREHGPSLTLTPFTALIGAATAAALLSCARGAPPARPLPDTVPDTPADVTGARPDTPADVTGARPDMPADVTGAGAQDSALMIPPLLLPPMIGREDDRAGEAGITVRLRGRRHLARARRCARPCPHHHGRAFRRRSGAGRGMLLLSRRGDGTAYCG
jgi:hypothetical protein